MNDRASKRVEEAVRLIRQRYPQDELIGDLVRSTAGLAFTDGKLEGIKEAQACIAAAQAVVKASQL